MPRLVSYTIQAVAAADLDALLVTRAGSNVYANGTFNLKDENGATVGQANASIQLSAPQITAISNFITSHLVPVLNDEQDL